MLAVRNGHAPWAAPTNRLATLIDRFFDDAPFAPPPAAAAARPAVPLAVWEDENAVTVEFDLPGVKDSAIEVSVHEGVLSLTAERTADRPAALFDSRPAGKVEQRVTLPAEVDAERVEARLAHGVLTVTLPKTPASRPRKIAVRTE